MRGLSWLAVNGLACFDLPAVDFQWPSVRGLPIICVNWGHESWQKVGRIGQPGEPQRVPGDETFGLDEIVPDARLTVQV